MNKLLSACILLIAVSCDSSSPKSSLFEKGVSLGTNKNEKLEEASGLVESLTQPDYLWTHNDSGNPAELFMINKKAETKRVFKLDGIDNRDWEDIAVGKDPADKISYLFVGDIGDNLTKHKIKFIYKVKEPDINSDETIRDITVLKVRLEDEKRDSETLLFDPVSSNLYLVSKRGSEAGLYEIPYPYSADTITAKKVASLPYRYVDGGSISSDGKEVLLRTYTEIYYWKRTGNESIPDLLKNPAVELAYDKEPQGEAVAWAADGSGYYTLSENAKGQRGRLYFYKRN